jgi:hypothetical protein
MKLKYFKISGGCFNSDEFEDVTEAFSHEEALHEAYQMACEAYDDYAGLHGIMSEEDYIEEGEAENYDEAWELYREDRESTIEYEAVEITKEQYEAFFGEGML